MSAAFAQVILLDGPCLGPQRGCSPPELRVTGNGELSISQNITIGADAVVQVASSTPVSLGGDFDNRSRFNTNFDWSSGALSFDGVATQTFEAAGQDVGPSLAGFSNNYAMGRLIFPATADVAFVDLIDNDFVDQTTCGEAVYARVLELNPGSMIELNEVKLYYGRRTSTAGSFSFVGCGQLINVPTGDFDGDGDVDEGDYASFADCASGPNAAPTPVLTTVQQCLDVFDFDDDSDVDAGDFGEFTLVFSP